MRIKLLVLIIPVLVVLLAGTEVRADSAPDTEWTRQFGSSSDERVLSVSVDSTGVYVAGYTWGTLPGQSSSGG
ncbi:hypothetical protein ACFLWG_04090 [Chloroflexota bacterium]